MFTWQPTLTPLQILNEPSLHTHCFNCINISKCNVELVDGFSCKIICCPNNCNFRFHACKKDEHELLCLEEKVPCYNVNNGCPFKMKRKLLSAHLKHCPASVIYCTMEWHRSLKIIEEMQIKAIHLHCSSCIVETCVQEAMLGYSCEIFSCPLNCGKIMHTCKYNEHQLECPNEKVPCPNASYGCQYITSRKNIKRHFRICYEDYFLQENKLQNGPSKEMLSQFKDYSQKSPLDVALALRDLNILKWQIENQLPREIRPDYWHYNQAAFKPISKSCSQKCLTFNTDSEVKNLAQLINNLTVISAENIEESNPRRNYMLNLIKELIVENERLKMENKKLKIEHKTTQDINVNGNGIAKCSTVNLKDCNSTANDTSKFCDNWEKIDPEKSTWNNIDSCDLYFTSNVFDSLLTYPTRFLGLHHASKCSCNVGYQEFTFFCSQEFRRDEYHTHYKNVHNDIQGGLNGYLQQRCPLAIYGCTFARQSLKPAPIGSEIIYNETLESFGIKPQNYVEHQKISDNKSVSLCDMPYEILQHIIRYLDSFSLTNLYYSCELMHDVCYSLLMERGMATIRWEQREIQGKLKWVESGIKWNFSTHFTPISNWTFDTSNSIAEHLKTCKFNDRVIRFTPFRHGDPIDDVNQWKKYNSAKGQLGKQTSES